MKLGERLRPHDLPSSAPWLPGVTVRLLILVIAVALTAVDYGDSGWLLLGLIFSCLAAWEPKLMGGWVLMLFLAVGQISHADTLDWRLLVLVAGLHLLHVFSALGMEVPVRARMSPAVLAGPLIRWLAIQVPCQALAVVALLLLAPGRHGHRPVNIEALAVIGVLALIGLALLLLYPESERP